MTTTEGDAKVRAMAISDPGPMKPAKAQSPHPLTRFARYSNHVKARAHLWLGAWGLVP